MQDRAVESVVTSSAAQLWAVCGPRDAWAPGRPGRSPDNFFRPKLGADDRRPWADEDESDAERWDGQG